MFCQKHLNVAQLEQPSDIRGSNPGKGKFLAVNCVQKTKIDKRGREWFN